MSYQIVNVSGYHTVSNENWKSLPSIVIVNDIRNILQWDAEDDIVCVSFEDDKVFQLINDKWVEEIHEFSEDEDCKEEKKNVSGKLFDDISRNNYTTVIYCD